MKPLDLDKPLILNLLSEDDKEGDLTNKMTEKLDEYNSQLRHKFINGNENLFNLKRSSHLTKEEIIKKNSMPNENEHLAKLIIQTARNSSVGTKKGLEESTSINLGKEKKKNLNLNSNSINNKGNENLKYLPNKRKDKNKNGKNKNDKNKNFNFIEERKSEINESVGNKNFRIYNDFLQKSKHFSSQKEAEIEKLKKKINDARERECTFKPTINGFSSSSSTKRKYDYKSFMKNLAEYNINKFNASKMNFNNKFIQENLQTYHPTISSNSIKIISRNNIYNSSLPIHDRLYYSKEDISVKRSKIIIPSPIKKSNRSMSPKDTKNYLEMSKHYIKELEEKNLRKKNVMIEEKKSTKNSTLLKIKKKFLKKFNEICDQANLDFLSFENILNKLNLVKFHQREKNKSDLPEKLWYMLDGNNTNKISSSILLQSLLIILKIDEKYNSSINLNKTQESPSIDLETSLENNKQIKIVDQYGNINVNDYVAYYIQKIFNSFLIERMVNRSPSKKLNSQAKGKPNINMKSKQIVESLKKEYADKNRVSTNNLLPGELYRNNKKRNRKNMIENFQIELKQSEIGACTFKPQLHYSNIRRAVSPSSLLNTNNSNSNSNSNSNLKITKNIKNVGNIKDINNTKSMKKIKQEIEKSKNSMDEILRIQKKKNVKLKKNKDSNPNSKPQKSIKKAKIPDVRDYSNSPSHDSLHFILENPKDQITSVEKKESLSNAMLLQDERKNAINSEGIKISDEKIKEAQESQNAQDAQEEIKESIVEQSQLATQNQNEFLKPVKDKTRASLGLEIDRSKLMLASQSQNKDFQEISNDNIMKFQETLEQMDIMKIEQQISTIEKRKNQLVESKKNEILKKEEPHLQIKEEKEIVVREIHKSPKLTKEELPIRNENEEFDRNDSFDSQNMPIMYIDVNIDSSKTERIIVFKNDSPRQLALKFGEIHNLDQKAITNLESKLEVQIQTMLDQIEEENISDDICDPE